MRAATRWQQEYIDGYPYYRHERAGRALVLGMDTLGRWQLRYASPEHPTRRIADFGAWVFTVDTLAAAKRRARELLDKL